MVITSKPFIPPFGKPFLNPFGDQDPFSPTDLTTLTAWFRGDLGVTLNGSDVSDWADQSGLFSDFAQSTASQQPLFNSSNSNFNNRPTLDFDRTTFENMQTGTVTAISHPFTIFIVVKWASFGGVPDFIHDGTQAANRVQFLTTGGNQKRIAAGTTGITGTAFDTNTHVYLLEFNSTTSAIYVDGGATDASGDIGDTDALVSFTIAGDRLGNQNNGSISIAELVVTSDLPSVSDRNLTGNYMANRYGTTWTNII